MTRKLSLISGSSLVLACLLALPPCRAADLKADDIKSISKTIDTNDLDFASKDDCSSFTMTKRQVAEFVKRAQFVPEGERLELDWYPCSYEGTMKKGAGVVNWEINLSCVASIWSDTGDGGTYYYGDCERIFGDWTPAPDKDLAPCREAKAGGPEDVVRALYQAYPAEGREDIKDAARTTLVKFFDERFTRALLKNQECDDPEEFCYIGENILYDAKDPKIRGVRVCAMDAARKTVTVEFRDHGDPRDVTYKLTRTAAGWRIADIVIIFSDGFQLSSRIKDMRERMSDYDQTKRAEREHLK